MKFFRKYYYVYVFVLAGVFAASMLASRGIDLAVAVMSQTPPKTVIVIDAGHGGEDGGAVSCTGVSESELNLQISLRMHDLLTLLGIPTKMVRTEDVAVYSPEAQTVSEKKVSDLKNRVKLVKDTPGALLLSIHQNMFSDGKYSGAQVFYAKGEQSKMLAGLLQSELAAQTDPQNHRETKPANSVYLMQHIDCTGVLVECGFLSNRQEEQKLRTPDYQKKIACAIAQGLLTYLSQNNTV